MRTTTYAAVIATAALCAGADRRDNPLDRLTPRDRLRVFECVNGAIWTYIQDQANPTPRFYDLRALDLAIKDYRDELRQPDRRPDLRYEKRSRLLATVMMLEVK